MTITSLADVRPPAQLHRVRLADHDTVVHALAPPIGRPHEHEPVIAREFLRERLDAITVG